MYWWAYIIVWIFSLLVPLFLSEKLYKIPSLKVDTTNEILMWHNFKTIFVYSCIFATLNCIFCAILFGLK